MAAQEDDRVYISVTYRGQQIADVDIAEKYVLGFRSDVVERAMRITATQMEQWACEQVIDAVEEFKKETGKE